MISKKFDKKYIIRIDKGEKIDGNVKREFDEETGLNILKFRIRIYVYSYSKCIHENEKKCGDFYNPHILKMRSFFFFRAAVLGHFIAAFFINAAICYHVFAFSFDVFASDFDAVSIFDLSYFHVTAILFHLLTSF